MTIIFILAILASILLIFIVLIQNSKGGGISANFSAANQIAGVKKTNDFIEKATWYLAIALLVLSLGSSFLATSSNEKNLESIMQEEIENASSFDQQVPVDAGIDQQVGDGQAAPQNPGSQGGQNSAQGSSDGETGQLPE